MTIFLLVLSVVAATSAFSAGDERVSFSGFEALRTSWLGWFALVVVTLVLLDSVYDLRGQSVSHDGAVRRLAALRSQYRMAGDVEPGSPEEERLTAHYQLVQETLPVISNRQFIKLKAYHLRKVAISKYLSGHAGISCRQARKAVKRKATQDDLACP